MGKEGGGPRSRFLPASPSSMPGFDREFGPRSGPGTSSRPLCPEAVSRVIFSRTACPSRFRALLPGASPESMPRRTHSSARAPARASASPTSVSRAFASALVLALAGAGCASAPPPSVPPVDPGAVQSEAMEASALDHPVRIVFQWELVEPGVRIRGQGVARVEPPYRARLDLFTAGGERVGAAALVNDELRVPPGMAVAVPPPAMLWGALGVFRPGPGVYGASATRPEAGRATLRYLSSEGGTLEVAFRDRRIERMARSPETGPGADLRVRFGGADERFPRDAVYRDHGAVRELRITTESVEHVETFPPEIWNPGGPGG